MPSAAEVLSFVEYLINSWGIFIVPIGAFLENSVILSFIFPGVTVIFLSGFVARTTDVSLVFIIILATIGSFLGDNFDYFLGRRAGKILEVKPLFAKPVAKVEPLVMHHGIWAIFAGRFSGWSRAWVALACGIVKFSYLKFAVVSAISALTWTTVWIIGGYLLGGNRQLIEEWLGRVSVLFWLTFTILLIYYFRTRVKLILDLVIFIMRKYGNRIKNGFNNNQ